VTARGVIVTKLEEHMLVRLSFKGTSRDPVSGERRNAGFFLKPQYIGRKIEVNYDDRSSLVRTFMDVFLEREYTTHDIKAISRFLKRYHLNRAEVLAVIHHLGYRYSKRYNVLGNVAVADYLDFNPNKNRGYTEQDKLSGVSELTFELYQEFKRRVLELGDNVKVIPWKGYISFVAGKTFVDVRPQQTRLKLWINLPKGGLDDPKNITRDMSETGHWGNGDYEVKVNSSAEFDYLMTLIKQSYTKHS
jgi:predicted transport protein